MTAHVESVFLSRPTMPRSREMQVSGGGTSGIFSDGAGQNGPKPAIIRNSSLSR